MWTTQWAVDNPPAAMPRRAVLSVPCRSVETGGRRPTGRKPSRAAGLAKRAETQSPKRRPRLRTSQTPATERKSNAPSEPQVWPSRPTGPNPSGRNAGLTQPLNGPNPSRRNRRSGPTTNRAKFQPPTGSQTTTRTTGLATHRTGRTRSAEPQARLERAEAKPSRPEAAEPRACPNGPNPRPPEPQVRPQSRTGQTPAAGAEAQPQSSASTQSKVLVTAFFHWPNVFSRTASSIDGCHSLSLAQLLRMSSSPAQKPTARPAA